MRLNYLFFLFRIHLLVFVGVYSIMKFSNLSKLPLSLAVIAISFVSFSTAVQAEDQAFLSVFSPITGQTIQQGYPSATNTQTNPLSVRQALLEKYIGSNGAQ